MLHIRLLHNGDLGKTTAKPSPHWMMHIGEDGTIWGEVLTREAGRNLPENFRIPNHQRFFDIPAELRTNRLMVQPRHEEIIISLVQPGGHSECSFLMSQLPSQSGMRDAIEEVMQKIQDFIKERESAA
jgi:hypothetical protein